MVIRVRLTAGVHTMSVKYILFPLYFFGRIVSGSQFEDVRNYGVYDVLSQQLLSGDSLCSGIGGDSIGSYPDDPSIYGGVCYYGGQTDPAKGDCAASAIGDDRRVCPCSQFGKRT